MLAGEKVEVTIPVLAYFQKFLGGRQICSVCNVAQTRVLSCAFAPEYIDVSLSYPANTG